MPPPATTPPCTVNVTLREHQHRIIRALLSDRPNLLFVAGTGSGKTISAIVSGVCLITNGHVDGVVIVTPTGVHEQFAHEVRRLVPPQYANAFQLHTHHTFFHADTDFKTVLRRKLLVVDEAHALVTHIARDRETREVVKGKMAYQATLAAQRAERVLLLTATPVKNTPTELFNLVCLIRQQPYERFYREHARYRQDLDKLFREFLRTGHEYLLQRRRKQNLMVQTYTNAVRPYIEFAQCSREGFPAKHEQIVRLTMDKEYLELYNRVEQEKVEEAFDDVLDRDQHNNDNTGVPLQLLFDPNKASCFFSKVRVAVNGITEFVTSQKVEYALTTVYRCHHSNRRSLVYSNFLNGGLSLIARELDRRNIPYCQITGSVTAVERRDYVNLFNQNTVRVLLISAAGSEGLDLKCVRDVIILEPHFHDVRIEQVIGRAVRYRSHDTLPPEDRNVTIHRLLLCKPTESGDTWEAIEMHNLRAVRHILEKHRHRKASPRGVILDMHPMYKSLVQNTMHVQGIPQNRFRLNTLRTDNTLTVSTPSRYSMVRWFQSPIDRCVLKPPPTDISVDDLLHRLAMRKMRFLNWHLRQIRYGDSKTRSRSVSGRLSRRGGGKRRWNTCRNTNRIRFRSGGTRKIQTL